MVSGKHRVLMAERDPSVAEEVRALLADSCHIEVVSDGLAVLNRTRDLKPDLIITAILLPKLDGFQVCRQLKAGSDTAGIPILAVSSLLAGNRIRRAGADMFLAKPVDGSELRQAVERLIGRGRRRKR